MEPRYSFFGYLEDFEIKTNKYIKVYNHNHTKTSYYKFIDELDLNELEEMMKLKKTR